MQHASRLGCLLHGQRYIFGTKRHQNSARRVPVLLATAGRNHHPFTSNALSTGGVRNVFKQLSDRAIEQAAQPFNRREFNAGGCLAVEGGDGASIQARQAGDCRNVDLVMTHQGRGMAAHRDGLIVGMMRRTSKR